MLERVMGLHENKYSKWINSLKFTKEKRPAEQAFGAVDEEIRHWPDLRGLPHGG